MRIVKLGTHTSGLLFVNAALSRTMPGKIKRSSPPITFVADTASERSFICEYHQRVLEKTFGGHQPIQKIKVQTMVGTMVYSAFSGYSFLFECADHGTFSTASESGDVCFADGSLKSVPDPGGSVNFSILGRDVLRKAALIVPPGLGRDGVLIFEDPLNSAQTWTNIIKALNETKPPVPVLVKSPTDFVDWNAIARGN